MSAASDVLDAYKTNSQAAIAAEIAEGQKIIRRYTRIITATIAIPAAMFVTAMILNEREMKKND